VDSGTVDELRQRPGTCWSTRAARSASRAATKPSTRWPARSRRAQAPFTGNLGATAIPARASAAPALDTLLAHSRPAGLIRCAARAVTARTTSGNGARRAWRSALTPDRGANGSAIHGGRLRRGRLSNVCGGNAECAPTFTCETYLIIRARQRAADPKPRLSPKSQDAQRRIGAPNCLVKSRTQTELYQVNRLGQRATSA
jgi:hypothetical protein